MMKDELLRFVREHDLISPGDTVTCAVSGGADSMAMLWALYSLRKELGIRLRCAHFNHGLRENAGLDEAFVRDFCARFEIPLSCGRGSVSEEALPGESPELAARRLRYDFLHGASQGSLLATAHTADDHLETLLIRLTRGTSLRGLGGIPVRHNSIIRPILFATRTQVLAFLAKDGIDFREDESNQEDFCPRNRIRHHVVPHLREENPSIARACVSLSAVLREEDRFLSQLADKALQSAADGDGYNCKALAALPSVLRRRALFSILQRSGVELPSQRHMQQLDTLVHASSPSARADFPRGVLAARRYGQLFIRNNVLLSITPTPLNIPGITRIPGTDLKIVCSIPKKFDKIENSPTIFLLRCDMIGNGGLVVRSRQTGDRMQLIAGSRSLKRLMIDRKIPASQRALVPVLADDNGIAAVGGIGADLRRLALPGMDAIKIQIEKEDADHDA